jgi:hypothetical protein
LSAKTLPQAALSRSKVKLLMKNRTTIQKIEEHLDPEVQEQLSLGREFMREYRDTFRALANHDCSTDSEESK